MKFYSAVRAIAVLPALLAAGFLLGCGGGSVGHNSENEPKLKQILIAPTNPTIAKGATLQLSATGMFDDGVERALPGTPSWQISQSAVATIDAQGNVTAISEGNTQVSAVFQGITGNTSVSVGAPALVSITVSLPQTALPIGETEQLTAMGKFSDSSTLDLTQSATWAFSGSAVASVSVVGVAAANAMGLTTITATYGSVSGSANLTVTPAAVISLNVIPPTISISMGSSRQLQATAVYSNGTTQDVTGTATWTSSQSGIASVTPQGTVTGVTKGASVLAAAYQGATGTAAVAVGPPALLSIAIAPSQSSLPVGESKQLTAMGSFSDGSLQNLSSSVAWTASGASVAVNASGSVLANAVGTTNITATSGTITGSASVTVIPAVVTAVNIVPNTLTISLGTSHALKAMATMSDGTTQDVTGSATWSSTLSTVASVNPGGNVAGLGKGTAQVSAAYQGLTGSASVTIGPPALVSITLSPNPSSLPLGESEQLTATGSYSDGSVQNLNQTATWSSNQSATASVNAQGKVTGVGKGITQISASYQGLAGTASLTVGAPALLSITITPNPSSLPLGESEQLTATGSYSDGSVQDITPSVSWGAYGSAVANISVAGSVKASAIGAFTISATSGSIVGTANVTITPPVITAISVVPATSSMVLGSTNQFQALATMSDGTVQDTTASATWGSTAPNIASVSGGGSVTALQVGTTTITAQVNSVTGAASLTVLQLVLVSYFSRINSVNSGIDDTIRLTNPGLKQGNLCAMVYVFDQKQELNECCGCMISADGMLTLSLLDDLTSNTLTGKKPRAGQIKIVPSDPAQNPQCNPSSLAPTSELEGWETNVQPAGSGNYQVTESTFDSVPLPDGEATILVNECGYARQLGSGAGVCSCGTGD